MGWGRRSSDIYGPAVGMWKLGRGEENNLNFYRLKCWQGERFVFIRYLVMTGIGGVEERGLDYEQ